MKEMVARRYNKGKLRYELISDVALQELAKVYTKGAEKYSDYDANGNLIYDGSSNWRQGLPWMDAMASVQRHIQAWKNGEDNDPELGDTKHLAHAAWGLFAILEFYKTHPELDNRNHSWKEKKKIGLDIDHVICDWEGAWRAKFGGEPSTDWNFSYRNFERFKSFSPEELEEFYLGLPVLMKPEDIPFTPHCYITSRSVPQELTMKWLENNGFPCVPVYSVGFGQSKVDAAKAAGIDIFVDDSFNNFVEMNKAGITTYLYDATHNQKFNVGHFRIKNLRELI